jgi:hypothetical protein
MACVHACGALECVGRRGSAKFGTWTSTVAKQTHRYVRPQENGNKLDTRWMALTDADNKVGTLFVSLVGKPCRTCVIVGARAFRSDASGMLALAFRCFEHPCLHVQRDTHARAHAPNRTHTHASFTRHARRCTRCTGEGGGVPATSSRDVERGLPSLSMQCHHFDLQDFDCEDNTNVPRVRHGGELRERLFTSVCIDGAQAGIGGVDSWGSLPLMKYRLTLKRPIRWAFAMQCFGTRNVNKLPSVLEKTRKQQQRLLERERSLEAEALARKLAGEPPAEVGEAPSGTGPEDAGGEHASSVRAALLASISTPSPAGVGERQDGPTSPSGAGANGELRTDDPSAMARTLRLRFGLKVAATLKRLPSFDALLPRIESGSLSPTPIGNLSPQSYMSPHLSPLRGSSPEPTEQNDSRGSNQTFAEYA